MEAVISSAVADSQPDVYNVTFSGSGNAIVTSYLVSVFDSTTDAQVLTMFNVLVAAATDDTFISGRTVIAGSVAFDSRKFRVVFCRIK